MPVVGVGVGVGFDLAIAAIGAGGGFTSLDLFDGGEEGFIFDSGTYFEDVAATDPADTAGDTVANADDTSPAPDYPATQSTEGARPTLRTFPTRLEFDGSADFMSTTFIPGAAGTIGCRFKTSASGVQVPIGAGGSTGTGRNYLATSSGVIAGGMGSQGTSTIVGEDDVTGVWVNGFLTWNGTTVRLYQDDTEIYSGAQDGNEAAALAIYIGANNVSGSASSFFDGDVSKAIAIDRVLTPEEIASLSAFWTPTPATITIDDEPSTAGIGTITAGESHATIIGRMTDPAGGDTADAAEASTDGEGTVSRMVTITSGSDPVVEDETVTVLVTYAATGAANVTRTLDGGTVIAVPRTATALFGDGENAPWKPFVLASDLTTAEVRTLTGTPVLSSGSAGAYTASVSDGGLSFGAGDGAPDGAVYTCDDTEGDTWEITVSEVANAVSVNSYADMEAAVDALHTASASTDWDVLMRAQTYGTPTQAAYTITFPSFDGTFDGGNDGVTIIDPLFDRDARASISGGSVTIRSDQNLGAGFFQRMEFTNAGWIIVEVIDWSAQPSIDQYIRDYAGTDANTTQAATPMLRAGGAIVRDNRFGGIRSGASVNRPFSGCYGASVLEDNLFDFVYIAGNGDTTRRNVWHDVIADGMRLGFSKTEPWTNIVHDNIRLGAFDDDEWKSHADVAQVFDGSSSALGYVEFGWNVGYTNSNTNGLQYFYSDDGLVGANLTGIFAKNMGIVNKVQGAAFHQPKDLISVNNTIIASAEGLSSDPGVRMFINRTTEASLDNFFGNVFARNILNSGIGAPTNDDLSTENYILAYTADAYSAAFIGDFGSGSGVPSLALTASTTSEFLTNVRAAYTVDPEGPAAGFGHSTTVDLTTLPVLGSNFDSLISQPVDTVTDLGRRLVLLGGEGQVITAGAGTEYQIENAAGDVQHAWTSSAGTVDQGEYVRIRRTSSASDLTEVEGSVVVNGDTYTGSVKTVATTGDLVGSATINVDVSAGYPTTVSIPTLDGGLGGAPLEGDFVIVSVAQGTNTSRNTAVTGYDPIADLFANNTNDTNLNIHTKIMTATPDTEITLTGDATSGSSVMVTIQVWRNIDPAVPLDGVTLVGATNNNGILANPGPITPATSGAKVIVVAAAAASDWSAGGLEHASLTSLVSAEDDTGSIRAAIATGYVDWTSGELDLAAFTSATTGNASTDSWCAAVFALRPAVAAFATKGAANTGGFTGPALPTGTDEITIEMDIEVAIGTNASFKLLEYASETVIIELDTTAGDRGFYIKSEKDGGATATFYNAKSANVMPTTRTKLVVSIQQNDGSDNALMKVWIGGSLILDYTQARTAPFVFDDSRTLVLFGNTGAECKLYSVNIWDEFTATDDTSGLTSLLHPISGDAAAWNTPTGSGLTKTGDAFT